MLLPDVNVLIYAHREDSSLDHPRYAVAIEHGCTLVSTDADFDRFPDLRWLHPLRPAASLGR